MWYESSIKYFLCRTREEENNNNERANNDFKYQHLEKESKI